MYIVINGGGKVASYLARTLIEHGHDVALIEKRDDVAEKLAAELPGSRSSSSATAATPLPGGRGRGPRRRVRRGDRR